MENWLEPILYAFLRLKTSERSGLLVREGTRVNKGEVKPLTSGERASISKFHIVVTKTMLVLLLLLAQMLSNKLFAPAVREISFNRCLALSKER